MTLDSQKDLVDEIFALPKTQDEYTVIFKLFGFILLKKKVRLQ